MIHDKLFGYQKQDRDDMLARKTAILAEQIGAGKSIIAMSVMDMLWQSSLVDKVLVVVPNSAIPQWCDMIREWLDVEAYPVYGGRGKEDRYYKYEWFKNSIQHPILIINYSSLRTDLRQLLYLGFKICFYDEATAIKGLDSATALAARQLSLSCEYRYLMTGCPIQNNLLELHSLMSAVEPNVLGQYMWFRSRFCVEQEILVPVIMADGRRGVRPVRKIVGYRNLEELQPAINIYCIRHGQAEVSEKLPEVVIENRFVELSPMAKVKYNEIASGVLNMDASSKPINPLERLIRMFECCDSLKMLGDTEDRSSKIDEVISLLTGELSGTSTVIFSQFKLPIKSIGKRLNDLDISFAVIDGDVPVEQRAKAQTDFNSGLVKVLLITTAGGFALNLQTGKCIILLDRVYNPMVMCQVIGRIARIGQTNRSVAVINIIAKDTVDEHHVFKILKQKVGLINDIFVERELNSLGLDELKCLVKGEASRSL